jgi:hypothetical protein
LLPLGGKGGATIEKLFLQMLIEEKTTELKKFTGRFLA